MLGHGAGEGFKAQHNDSISPNILLSIPSRPDTPSTTAILQYVFCDDYQFYNEALLHASQPRKLHANVLGIHSHAAYGNQRFRRR